MSAAVSCEESRGIAAPACVGVAQPALLYAAVGTDSEAVAAEPAGFSLPRHRTKRKEPAASPGRGLCVIGTTGRARIALPVAIAADTPQIEIPDASGAAHSRLNPNHLRAM